MVYSCRHHVIFILIGLFLVTSPTKTNAFVVRQTRSPFGIRSIVQATSAGDVIERLQLADNFNRWRFMQNLLDAELEATEINEVIYRVLEAFLKDPNPNRSDDGETVSPRATPQVRETIESLLEQSESPLIAAFADPDCSPGSETVLMELEKLLPTMEEDEDAFKGSWDSVIELHGREAVKIDETEGEPQWKALCLVSRVLIYFGFLSAAP